MTKKETRVKILKKIAEQHEQLAKLYGKLSKLEQSPQAENDSIPPDDDPPDPPGGPGGDGG